MFFCTHYTLRWFFGMQKKQQKKNTHWGQWMYFIHPNKEFLGLYFGPLPARGRGKWRKPWRTGTGRCSISSSCDITLCQAFLQKYLVVFWLFVLFFSPSLRFGNYLFGFRHWDSATRLPKLGFEEVKVHQFVFSSFARSRRTFIQFHLHMRSFDTVSSPTCWGF